MTYKDWSGMGRGSMGYRGRPCSACMADPSGTGPTGTTCTGRLYKTCMGWLGKGCMYLKACMGRSYKTYTGPWCTSGELSCTVCKGLWYSPGDDNWNPCID